MDENQSSRLIQDAAFRAVREQPTPLEVGDRRTVFVVRSAGRRAGSVGVVVFGNVEDASAELLPGLGTSLARIASSVLWVVGIPEASLLVDGKKDCHGAGCTLAQDTDSANVTSRMRISVVEGDVPINYVMVWMTQRSRVLLLVGDGHLGC